MECNGSDSIIFTFTPPREVFDSIFRFVLARWPAALVADWDGPPEPEPLAGFSLDRVTDKWTQLQFFRDAAMFRHMEVAPYQPMPDGDGPFAVLARVRRDVEFAISETDERRAADHTPDGGQPPSPYAAWLCARSVVEVSTVTPDRPDASPFAAWVLNEVKRACAHSG
jgi:hypothetical protein